MSSKPTSMRSADLTMRRSASRVVKKVQPSVGQTAVYGYDIRPDLADSEGLESRRPAN